MTELQYWFTSDLHFGHKNIVEYCNRPWTYEEQNDEIIRRWNDRVGLMDHVFHLGDFTFAGRKGVNKTIDIIKQLNGQITFIRGNHCQPNLWQGIQDANIPHIVDVCDYKELSIGSQKIIMCHYPFETWNLAHHGSWHLHGHCHGSLPAAGKRLDVGIDNHPDWQVFSLDEVREHMAKQAFVVQDHHEGARP